MDGAVARLNLRRSELELKAARRRGLSDRAAALWKASIDRRRAELEGRTATPRREAAAFGPPTRPEGPDYP